MAGWLGGRRTVVVAAATAFLVRLVGLTRPVRADEAGFTLVARGWHPSADSVYGAYFVDRPPPLIAVFKLADWIGGPSSIRVVGALSAAALVLLAAWVARLVTEPEAATRSTTAPLSGARADELRCSPAPQSVAVAAAALATTPAIDVVATKGELLALPLLVGAVGLAVVSVRDRAARAAFGAGLLAALALGLKQNLAGAAGFTGVLLIAAVATRRVSRAAFVRLAAAALAGFAVPVLATVAWALAAGVRMHTLWYAVYGFRGDASAALGDGPATAPARRAAVLVGILVVTGILAALAAYVGRVRAHWRADPALTAAVLAMVAVDVVALALGGSFWQDYAFGLVPGTLLALALVGARVRERLVPLVAGSTVLCLVGWAAYNLAGQQEYDEHDTGVALRAVAEPGDDLVVYGGRADVQLESGMPSPYAYLWSLPMRTLDPDLSELDALVESGTPPTWIVEWVRWDNWDEVDGRRLGALVEQRYERHGTACGDRPVWLLEGVDREEPRPDCRGPGLFAEFRR